MSESLTTVPRWLFALAPLLLVAWAGLAGAGDDALWYDEWWSVYYAGAAAQYPGITPADTWSRVSAEFHELNPPGYYIALNLWGRVSGYTAAALRTWSVWAGLLAVAATYRLAADLHTPTAGVLAAGALATSAFFVGYTHEARAYAQLAALAALTALIYWRLVHRQRGRAGGYMAFGLGVAGLLYTHYTAVLMLAALALYHLLFAPKNRRWWAVTLTALVAGIAFVPWGLRAIEALAQVDGDGARDFYALGPLAVPARGLAAFSNGSALLVLGLAWFARWRGRFVLWLAAITLLLASAANVQVGFLTDAHYLLAVFPALAVVVGVGLASVPVGRWAFAGLWGAVGLWLIVFPPLPDEVSLRRYVPWDALLAAVEPEAARYDTLAFLLPAPDPNWIHQPVADFYAAAATLRFVAIDSPPGKPPAAFEDELEQLATTQDRLWIAQDTRPAYAPSRYAFEMRSWMVQQRHLLDCGYSLDVGSVRARLYAGAPRPGWVTQLDGGVGVGPHHTPLTYTDAGDLTFFVITERTEAAPPGTYSVSVRLTPPGEQTIAYQQDFPLPDGSQACTYVRVPSAAVPPGEYEIAAVVYNWQTGERLPLADDPDAERVLLFNVSF